MALSPPRSYVVTGGEQEEGEEMNMMSLPTYLSQQQPKYKPQFYVEEASLYSIAEDSREGRQSEISSVRSCRSISTPRSTAKKEPMSPASTPSEKGEPIPVLMEWGLGMSGRGWGFNSNDEEEDDDALQNSCLGAKPSGWDNIPPTVPRLDQEELSTEYTYPMSDEPTFQKQKQKPCPSSRDRLKYPAIIAVLLITILIVVLSILLLRGGDSEPSKLVAGLATGLDSNTTRSPSRSPSSAPTAMPSSSPTATPTFPAVINTEEKQRVYTALSVCPANNMDQVIQPLALQNQIFDHLVAELKMDQSFSQQELIERWSLVMFFSTAGGEEWTNGNSWVLPKHVCEWGDGSITCDKRSNGEAVVTGLYLNDNNLAGFIPKELCCVPQLRTLILSNNLLFGRIPDCLNKMGLTTFDTSGNIGLIGNP